MAIGNSGRVVPPALRTVNFESAETVIQHDNDCLICKEAMLMLKCVRSGGWPDKFCGVRSFTPTNCHMPAAAHATVALRESKHIIERIRA
eukprot:1157025-Pelagomonas_calceolata.AAC.8